MNPTICTRGLLCLALGLLGPVRAASAVPLLSEVFYDATGADDGLTFVELWGDPGTLLEGLRLEGVNGANGNTGPVVPLSGAIPADGIFVVADEASGGGTLVAEADLVLDFDFQNGPDSVLLREGESTLDALGYGAFGPGEVFAGEGLPADDAPAGASLARRFADLDTDDNASDFVVLDAPTPGSAPLASVPEPGGVALSALGLALWASRRRPRQSPMSSSRFSKKRRLASA